MATSGFMDDIELVRDVFVGGEVAGFTPKLWKKLVVSPKLFRAFAQVVESSGESAPVGEQPAPQEPAILAA